MSDNNFAEAMHAPTPAQEAAWAAEEVAGMEALHSAAEAADEAEQAAHKALEDLLWERCPALMLDAHIWADPDNWEW